MKNKQLILLVDDDPDTLEFLSYNIRQENYNVITADNGKKGLEKAKEFKPDLIILDIMMPEVNGFETCEEIRKIPELDNTVIAFLTSVGDDLSQLKGFEIGADDYINKPIKPKIFISRVKALLRRRPKKSESSQNNLKVIGDLIIDKEKITVIYKEKHLIFPKKEFALLDLLSSKPNKVFTREEIYNSVWGEKIIVGDRTIDVHIRKLRKKIPGKHIVTIKGVGYKYVP